MTYKVIVVGNGPRCVHVDGEPDLDYAIQVAKECDAWPGDKVWVEREDGFIPYERHVSA